MKKQFLLIVSVVLLVSSCRKSEETNVVPSAAGAAQTGAAAKCGKSLSGSISYAFTTSFDLPCDCTSAYTAAGNFYGTGTLTHLGLSTSKIKPCLAPIMSGTTLIGYNVGVECGTLVAANGDEVWTNINPYAVYFGPTSAVGTVHIDIAGGTGRFAGATGSFTGTANVYFSLGTAVLSDIHGTIYY